MRSLLAGTNVAPASAKAAPVARHPQADPTPPWARIIITRLDEAKDEEISECETLRAQLEQAQAKLGPLQIECATQRARADGLDARVRELTADLVALRKAKATAPQLPPTIVVEKEEVTPDNRGWIIRPTYDGADRITNLTVTRP